ncbi:hypothetical protein UB46_41190 [Burkholderiaceae bacterium 16]|nr:hypothetical protein UB46_41190 [Burkholderiaceae bacterium 16]
MMRRPIRFIRILLQRPSARHGSRSGCLAAFNRISGIGIARCRCVAGSDQAIDKAPVVRTELKRQGFDIAVPLRLGTGPLRWSR